MAFLDFFKKTPPSPQEPPPDDRATFLQLLEAHLRRVASVSGSHAGFVEAHFTDGNRSLFAGIAAQKMSLSQADGDDHNVLIAQSPVCFDVTTFPVGMGAVRPLLERKYGGLATLAQNMAQRHPAFTLQGCTVLCLVAYGRVGRQAWVNLGIVPTGGAWRDAAVLPVEFLGDRDRAMLLRDG